MVMCYEIMSSWLLNLEWDVEKRFKMGEDGFFWIVLDGEDLKRFVMGNVEVICKV